MDEGTKLFMTPDTMEPLFPIDDKGKLEGLAMELIFKAARLSGTMNPITRKAIADFLRPMNSYYSNLIEGHDTNPIDIEKALKNNFSEDKVKRNLQLEAHAHIKLHELIGLEMEAINTDIIPSSTEFIKSIHKRFYEHLPKDFKEIKSKEGVSKQLIPGELRVDEVEVGRHIAPYSKNLPLFMDRFEAFYNTKGAENKSKTKRIISIAASHHRLAWIHPFLDGNGRVVRLFSDAFFIKEGLDSSGLWSISRGLARNNDLYKSKLANADLQRLNNYDGRGNLSNKMLIEFCEFFLNTAIDQINYMYQILDIDNMLNRIDSFTDLMVIKKRLKTEARYILSDVFLKGKITKTEAMRITNTSDKTLKSITDSLVEMDLIEAIKEGINMVYYVKYPINHSPMLFPGIYPSEKEAEMVRNA
ncbi:MAG: Fic family protein [Bacteroidia bacterium]|nr:Fic family protein [Bacteroidia bacterium]MCF8427880.1 Fic family protein [Bacteroidia bacterium]MCF8447281.1 Fic family protein [Bacteroidia bacterium]